VERCPALDPRLEAAMVAAKPRAKQQLAGLVAPDGRVQVAIDGEAEGALELGGGLEGDANGFAQASWSGNDELRRLVREAVGAPGRVLELFAGSGNFTRDLVALAPDGVAVEGDRAAGERLRRLLAPHPGWSARVEPAVRAVERLRGERFNVVVLDPPRAGAAEIIEALGSLAPRIVYVSCDPMTLARDCERLRFHGWAQPVDMMPHTSHVEVVARLEREK
jgi:23S rRNA (uracil1939-C5)-methyltransferase